MTAKLSEYGHRYLRQQDSGSPDAPANVNGDDPWEDVPPPDEPPPADEPDEPPDDPDPTEPSDEAAAFEFRVTQRADWLRIDAEARQRVDDETRPPIHYPPVRNLTAMLAEPDTATHYRIDAVAPADARIMLSAQYKAGKSTLTGNLIRALVDGDSFLGHFAVNTTASAVVLIDDEMSDNTLRSWLRAQNIRNTNAVADVITLRGNVGAFNLLNDNCFAAWLQRLHDVGCDYLIVDCLRPILDALALDEHRDAGRFLVTFDKLLNEAGIRDALLIQHMGHANERARGDSRLQDWPDAIWRLVREDDDPASPRYFTAYGRDVAVAEGRLSFDAGTRRMTYTAGSRHAVKVDDAVITIIKLLAEGAKDGDDGMSVRAIQTALAGEQPRDTVREALQKALAADDATRLIGVKKGPRNAKLHHLLHPCSGCGLPVLNGGPRHQSCPADPAGLFDE
jgi:AAA domain